MKVKLHFVGRGRGRDAATSAYHAQLLNGYQAAVCCADFIRSILGHAPPRIIAELIRQEPPISCGCQVCVAPTIDPPPVFTMRRIGPANIWLYNPPKGFGHIDYVYCGGIEILNANAIQVGDIFSVSIKEAS